MMLTDHNPSWRWQRAALAAALVMALLPAAAPAWAEEPGNVPVPFVGCSGDGQGGPVEAPTSSNVHPMLADAEASRLAYYAYVSLGVLAPRGWHCHASYGSGGVMLLVTPDAPGGRAPSRTAWKLRGPAVVLTFISAENSGRNQAAELAGPLFPAARRFVRGVDANARLSGFRLHPASIHKDRVRHRNSMVVGFVTPAGRDGLGTSGRLAPDPQPVMGVVTWLPQWNNGVLKLDVRLPPHLRTLTSSILDQAEVSLGDPGIIPR